MTDHNTEETQAFFNDLQAFVEMRVAPGGEFEKLALTVDQDFRGFKYDVISIRVRNDGKATGRGIMETHHYDF